MDTDFFMYDIKLTDEFNLWLRRLKDHSTRIRLARRLEKASRGLLGDVKPVGDGLYEMREHILDQVGECITFNAGRL
jgi:putative addiction module killer protein